MEFHKSGGESSRITIRFNSNFITHYTLALSGFVSRYSEIPHDNENVGRFEYESHNFECLLEKVHCFHRWPVIPFVNLTRSLTCQLMLESFTKMELLKVGRRSLILFEDRMDDISAEIGALETLNLYRDLVLQLRKWIHSYPEDCLALCEETFLPNILSRYHTIDKLLAMSNYNKRGYYYNQLEFTYYQSFDESFCYSYCAQYPYFQTSMLASFTIAGFQLLAILLLICKEFKYKERNAQLFYAFKIFNFICLLFDLAFALSLHMIMYVGQNHCGFPLRKTTARSIKVLYYIVLCTILTGALTLVLRKDPIMVHFICICIVIADILKLLSPRVVLVVHHIFIVVVIIDAYIFEIDIVNYVHEICYVFAFFPNKYYFVIIQLPIVYVLLYLGVYTYIQHSESQHYIII